jgi:hypothetical protein
MLLVNLQPSTRLGKIIGSLGLICKFTAALGDIEYKSWQILGRSGFYVS